MEEKKTKQKRVKVGAFRMVAWQSSALSTGINLLALGFVTIFCTDTLGMPAALVGSLLMASKLFDGVTDLLAGFIIDNTNSRWGKGRPYELCLIAAWVCTILLYSCPTSFSMTMKAVWLFVMYALVNSVFQTFLKGNNLTYMLRAFESEDQHVALQTYGSIITFFGAVVFNVSFPILMAKIATSPKGWSTLILLYAVPLCLFGMMRFIFIKESNNIDVQSDKVKLNDIWTVLKNNKYIYYIVLSTLALNFVTGLSSGVGTYYFTYIVGNVSLLSIMSFVQMFALPVLLVYPKLIKKYSAKVVLMIGFVIMGSGYLLLFFAGSSVPLLALGSLMMAFGSAPTSAVTPLLLIECAEYNEWKGMQRLEGTMTSVRGFASKIGAGIGSGCLGILMGMSGYISEANAAQPDSALLMIRMLYSIIPAVLIIVVVFVLKFYDLNKSIVQIREENKQRRLENGGK